SDLYLLSDISSRETSAALTRLRRDKHVPIIGSVGRILLEGTYYPTKTYLYGRSKLSSLRHTLAIAHFHALAIDSARKLQIPIGWKYHERVGDRIPDGLLALPTGTWKVEVDMGTERRKGKGSIFDKLDIQTIVLVTGSRKQFEELARLPGLTAFHEDFHAKE